MGWIHNAWISFLRQPKHDCRSRGAVYEALDGSDGLLWERCPTQQLADIQFFPSVVRAHPCHKFRSRRASNHAATSGSFEILVTAPYLYKGAVNQTSVTPAWRSALWHAAFFVAWGFDTTAPADIKPYYDAADTAADFMRAIAPNSGAYQNEAQVHEPNHEESFWGSNYSRLATLKMKYDPSGLLDCWHCIGWKGPNDARYKCYV